VGNTGNSSAPHLHIGVLRHRRLITHGDAKDVLRPMPFIDMHSIRWDKAKGVRKSDPWFKHTSGYGLCMPAGAAQCLIWPSRTLP
jgi:murein DD-endopeptidase MepM/ murein hydrolase activator NlpD